MTFKLMFSNNKNFFIKRRNIIIIQLIGIKRFTKYSIKNGQRPTKKNTVLTN
ncbi:MAG: hypothetical protein HW421_1035 [Ignavibacteria bacterium]|nr:hypothetical protein [Ignavibacteria bacterium]